jgi:hypothetical protein
VYAEVVKLAFLQQEQKRWRDEPLDPKRSSPPP